MNTDTVVFLTDRELAARWKVGRSTLAGHRATKTGCPFVTLGGSIRYRLADVEEYERQSLSKPS